MTGMEGAKLLEGEQPRGVWEEEGTWREGGREGKLEAVGPRDRRQKRKKKKTKRKQKDYSRHRGTGGDGTKIEARLSSFLLFLLPSWREENTERKENSEEKAQKQIANYRCLLSPLSTKVPKPFGYASQRHWNCPYT